MTLIAIDSVAHTTPSLDRGTSSHTKQPQHHAQQHNNEEGESDEEDHINFAQYEDAPFPLPLSDLYEIRQNSTSGRGIFAKTFLETGMVLIRTDDDNRDGNNGGSHPVKTRLSLSSLQPQSNSTSSLRDQFHSRPENDRVVVDAGSKERNSPLAYTILREYRKEVCAECFAYDRGREWKVKFESNAFSLGPQSLPQSPSPCRDAEQRLIRESRKVDASRNGSSKSVGAKNTGYSAGLVFCTEVCRETWLERYGILGVQAFVALEEAVQRSTRRKAGTQNKKVPSEGMAQESGNPVVKTSHSASPTDNTTVNGSVSTNSVNPSLLQIRSTWKKAQITAAQVRTARSKAECDLSKADRKIIRLATEPEEVNSDVCYYLLTGVLHAYLAAMEGEHTNGPDDELTPKDNYQGNADVIVDEQLNPRHENLLSSMTTTASTKTKNKDIILSSLLTLTSDTKCYAHPSSTLLIYTTSFLLLHAILPSQLTGQLTTTLSHELNSRASHNAFSIRPSTRTDGDQSGEFLGWGVWPVASLFNHSCSSNVVKTRRGRDWVFSVGNTTSPPSRPQDAVYKRDEDDEEPEGDLTGEERRKRGEGVTKDHELCITYLGGDERDLDVNERRKRLREGWGFWCLCTRCVQEEEREQEQDAITV